MGGLSEGADLPEQADGKSSPSGLAIRRLALKIFATFLPLYLLRHTSEILGEILGLLANA